MKQTFEIEGMRCSGCSSSVEKAVSAIAGVKSAAVNLVGKTLVCQYDESVADESAIISAIEKLGFTAEVFGKKNSKTDIDSKRKKGISKKQTLIISSILLVILMYVAMGHMMGFSLPKFLSGNENSLNFAVLQLLLTIPVIYLNRIYYKSGIKRLIAGEPNMDSLVAIGSGAALLYSLAVTTIIGINIFNKNYANIGRYRTSLYYDSAAMILTLITLGKMIEENAGRKTNSAVTKLINMSPKEAIVIRNGIEQKISAEDIVVNDMIVVKPGESIPVDGVVTDGNSVVDESIITGESLPVEKKISSEVISATINKTGSFIMRATKVGENTTIAKIIELVENAGASKAPIARTADKVAGIFVPIVMGIALITILVWIVVGKSFALSLSLGIAVLVISCPCALGLATPVAITAATGRCASKGILLKSAEAIETLHKTDTVVLDKTGTVTEGNLRVTKVVGIGMTEEELLKTAVSLEKKSEHPLAEAIINYAKSDDVYDVEKFEAIAGRGIHAVIDNDDYYGGNISFMNDLEIDISKMKINSYLNEGNTPMFFARNKELIGVIFAKDYVKDSSKKAVELLQNQGIDVIMLTGDNKNTAEAIRKATGIKHVIAEVLPQDKEEVISKIQKDGKTVVMVGDGINDSPALMRADVGIAIGSGTDIAIESADVVLVKNDLIDVYNAIVFSGRTMQIIKQNLFWAFFYNVIGIPIAAGVLYPLLGITLSPMISAACMCISSIFVNLNAIRLYRK